MEKYIESLQSTQSFRQNYKDGIDELIMYGYKAAEEIRTKYISGIKDKPDAYRNDFINLLGFPLNQYDKNEIPVAKKILLSKQSGEIIYRIEIEVYKNLNLCGLLFLHDETEKRPLVISQHGGGGTAELCSGIYDFGSSNYNDMTMRIFKQNVNVFAPQLLLWEKEKYGVEYDRGRIDAKLKQLGGSIAAFEVYALKKSLDYFTSLEIVAEDKIGMVGLSYGGSYTLFTAAADTRIKSSICCSFFNDRSEYSWPDWTWKNSAYSFLDAEIALLIYPRKLCVQLGKEDDLFNYEMGEKEFARLQNFSNNIYGNTDWLSFVGFDGNHMFCNDDKPIEKLVEDICKFN